VALALAAAGIAIIVTHTDGFTTPLGLSLVLLAALSWAGGNVVAMASGRVNMLAYVVWASLFSVPPLALLSLWMEGLPAIAHALHQAHARTWAAVLYQSAGNTMFGYASWGWLLARYPTATIAPASLLVPVFGIAASIYWLAEPAPAWKLAAGLLILSGLALNVLWPRLVRSAKA
jgi:O-acetylserine/cysteine efflux transporter